MHQQPNPSGSRQGEDEAHDLKLDLAKLAQDPADDLKAGLAKLALEAAPEPSHLGARLRNYFLTGLVVVGPVTITLYTAWYFINMVDAWVKPYIPRIYNPESYLPFHVPGVGLLFAIIGLTLIGALAANLIGRSLISAGELMLGRMPIVRNVHRGLKEIFSSVVTATGPDMAFDRVALVQFPSKGIWSLAFITGEAANEIKAQASGQELVSVFIPRENVMPIRLSVADAAKIILSAGMANPET